jgi:preprotein translocase subunit SecB
MTDTPNADQRQVAVQRIYLKDTSMEVPLAPQIFARQWTPEVDIQMGTAVAQVEADSYNVVLTVTVTAKLGNDVAFLAETHQAGVFQVKGFPPNELQMVLATYGPHTLFPFARETITGLVMRAGFPPLVLQPVNFDALYAEHLMRSQAQGGGNAPGSLTTQ